MTLREIRKSKGITQMEASVFLGVPLRTYSNYENDVNKQNSIKYRYMLETLNSYGYIDEEKGILSLDDIKTVCNKILSEYPVEYCYLFGSYAKGTPSEKSDVDLLVYTELSGLKFFGLVEELREGLKKKVDVLDQKQIVNNFELVNEILKDGIKIYG
jgi:predicted nucleotidyltransferase